MGKMKWGSAADPCPLTALFSMDPNAPPVVVQPMSSLWGHRLQSLCCRVLAWDLSLLSPVQNFWEGEIWAQCLNGARVTMAPLGEKSCGGEHLSSAGKSPRRNWRKIFIWYHFTNPTWTGVQPSPLPVLTWQQSSHLQQFLLVLLTDGEVRKEAEMKMFLP